MRASTPIIPMHHVDAKYGFDLYKYRNRRLLRNIAYPILGCLFLVFLYMKYSFGWIEAKELMELAKEKVVSFPIHEVSNSKFRLRRRLISTFLENSEQALIPVEKDLVSLNVTEEDGQKPTDPFQEFSTYLGMMQMFAVVNDMDYIMITFKEIDPEDYSRHDLHKYVTANFIKYNMYDDDMKKRTSYINDDLMKYYICTNHMGEGVMDIQVHKCTKEDLFVFNQKGVVIDAIDLDLELPIKAVPSSKLPLIHEDKKKK